MPTINAVGLAFPNFRYTSDEVLEGTRSWLQEPSDERSLFRRFSSSAQVQSRNFAIPLKELLALKGVEKRSAIFHEVGLSLATEAVNNCLEQSKTAPNSIETIIFTSCSLPIIPALDTHLIHTAGLSHNITRIPLYQHGCIGGAYALALAPRFGKTLIVSLELCSLVFDTQDTSPSGLVGAALFGDGCAAVLVDNLSSGFKIKASRSYLIPKTTNLMGYSLLDQGTFLLLDRSLPQILADNAPQFIQSFLADHNLKKEDINYWILHPGGVRILDLLHEHLDLEAHQTRWSWEVLKEHGNMSSATVLCALAKFLAEGEFKRGDKMVIFGVGPGLTVMAVLFECQ